MRNQVVHSRTCECPLCRGDVPAEIIKFRGSFDCPCCGKALKVHGTYELVIMLIAVAVGFLVARGAGFENVLLFCVGLMISPFLIVPIWRMSYVLKRPFLVPSRPEVTTLNLTGK